MSDTMKTAYSGKAGPGICRICECTDADCMIAGCIERTGAPCHWVEVDLCSACVGYTRAQVEAELEAIRANDGWDVEKE